MKTTDQIEMEIDKMSERELRKALHKSKHVIQDLMRSHEELLAGVANITVDFKLLNECRIAGDHYLRSIR